MANRFWTILWPWPLLSFALVGWTLSTACVSRAFGYDTDVIDMPVLAITGLLLAAGLAYAVIALRLDGSMPTDGLSQSSAFAIMVAAGLAARLILFSSEPILEDDYQRYLWDGAMTASGLNPYAYAPKAVMEGGATHPLAAIAASSGLVFERIGHAELTTIYPPLAQGAFALAHRIAPFSLTAWRGVLLVFDLATLALIVAGLKALARSSQWAVLYWWNPIVIKELFNGAHMDGLVPPFVLLALLLAQRRPLLATAAVGAAFGIKLWPVLLLPLIWRPLLGDWRRLGAAGGVFVPFAIVTLWPQIAAGLDRQAGIVAYASSWSRNSALTPALEALARSAGGGAHAALAARGLIAVALAAAVVALAWRPVATLDDLMRRATLAVGALLLLLPAQYPWYSIWLAPLLAINPIPGFLLLPAVLPLYELYFYFAAREMPDVFNHYVVWAIWIPVWAMLLADLRQGRLGCRETTPVNLRST